LQERGCKLTLITDSLETARAISGFRVLIEIDTDGHRAGATRRHSPAHPPEPRLRHWCAARRLPRSGRRQGAGRELATLLRLV